MKLRKVLVVTLACTTVFATAGCGGDTGKLYIPTYEDNGQQIRMMADLPPNMSNEAEAQMYKEVGINAVPITDDFFSAAAVVSDNGVVNERAEYLKALEVCEKLGIDAFIRPHSSNVSKGPTTAPTYYETHFTGLDFRDYPAVKGFYPVDEPSYSQLDDLATRYVTWFNENYGGEDYEFFANLFACHNATALSGTVGKSYDDYAEKYLNEVLEKVNSVNKHFSVDYYVLRHKNGVPYMFETNLIAHADAAMRAKAHNVGLAAYVQTFGGNTDGQTYRIPKSFAEINFSIYNILSFGAHTLKYYGYRDFGTETHMVTEGKPNERYYWTKEANEYIKKYEHVLLAFTWEHLYTNVGTGSRLAVNEAFELVRDIVKPITDVKTVKSKYDITMNEFSDADGNKAFMLLNYDDPINARKNKVQLTFNDADGVMYYRNGEPTVVELEKHKFNMELEAGEGVFVIPLYKK